MWNVFLTNPANWIAIAGVAAAFAAMLATLRSIRRQIEAVVFIEYTRRYSEILADIPTAWRTTPPDRLAALLILPDDDEHFRHTMRRYFNLCAEEFYLQDAKKLDSATWKIWRQGIRDSMQLPCFDEGWRRVRGEYAGMKLFLRFIDYMAGER